MTCNIIAAILGVDYSRMYLDIITRGSTHRLLTPEEVGKTKEIIKLLDSQKFKINRVPYFSPLLIFRLMRFHICLTINQIGQIFGMNG